MHVIRPCIVLVFMVAAARADGTSDVRGGALVARPESANDAQALTARIDAVLAARWAEAKVQPAAIADDGEFLRRVSLDLIGKIPTAAEARDFLDDPGQRVNASLLSNACWIARLTPLGPPKSGASFSCPRPIPKTPPARSPATSRRGSARR